MGGWLMIATAFIMSIAAALIFRLDWSAVGPPLLALLAFALIGTIDDFANLRSREGIGLKVRYKFIWHTVLALIPAVLLYLAQASTRSASQGSRTISGTGSFRSQR